MPSNAKERCIPYLCKAGPGQAKGELKKRLEHVQFRKRIIAIETADQMTVRQIAAKVREYLHK